jgi:hypothetical protein
MAVYKFVWPTGYSAHMTVPQFESACKVAERHNLISPVTVHPMFGGDGCILMQVGPMWIGVETDGYAHS